MSKATPTMTEDTKAGTTTTETGVWGKVGRKMKVGSSTSLKGLRFVVGKTQRMIQVPTEDTKAGTTPTDDTKSGTTPTEDTKSGTTPTEDT